MRKRITYIILILILSLQSIGSFAQQRFPKPEFESGHTQPQVITPQPRTLFMEYLDVFLLIAAMSVISWLIIKKRSRKGVFWMSMFSLLYFGFIREGCVCSVGSIQNVTLALFNQGYQIPLTVILFFLIPIIYTLFYGRTFCAGICPLGAIQDVLAFKPMKLSTWVQKLLGLIPYIYLGLGVLYAATSTDFIICRYDPFVGIFRFDATFTMFVIGGIFLVTSVFIARPYCRFLCPYGVILNWVSRFSKKHMTITPSHCIQCKLCEDSCPFGAIDYPVVNAKSKESQQSRVRRFIVLSLIIPLLMLVGGWTGAQFHENLASVNSKVQLANEFLNEVHVEGYIESEEVLAFKTANKPVEELYAESAAIIREFYYGGWILGAFIGLVFGLTLAGLSIAPYRTDYTPNRGECLSCARCMDYCPIDKENETEIKA